MRDKLAHVLKDASQLYGAQVLGLVVGFGISIVVARVLGAEGRGAYGWIMSLFVVAIQVGQMGGDVLNRRVAAQQPALASVLLANSLMQAWTWGLVVAAITLGVGFMYPVGQTYWGSLVLAVLLLPLNLTHGLVGSVAAGLGKFNVVAGVEVIQRLVMASVIGLMLLTIHLDVWHLLVAQGVALVACLVFLGSRMRVLVGFPWRIQVGVFKQHRAFMIGSFGAGLAWIFLQKIDVLMLGVWRPLAETGHYTVALTLIDAMVMLPGAIAAALMPRLAGEFDVRARGRLLLLTLAGVLVVFGFVCLGVGLLSPWLIPLLFGYEFAETVLVFQRLLIACWLMGGYYVCQQAVAGYGRARYQMAAPLVGLVVKVAFGWMFISHGMLAAANATILGYAAALGVALWIALRKG